MGRTATRLAALLVLTSAIGCRTSALRDEHAAWTPPPVQVPGAVAVETGESTGESEGSGAAGPRELSRQDVGRLYPDGISWEQAETAPKADATLDELPGWAHVLARSELLRGEWRRYQGNRFAFAQARQLEQLADRYQALGGRPEARRAPVQPSAETLMGRVVTHDIELARLRFVAAAYELRQTFVTAFHEARYRARVVSVLAENVKLSRRVADVVKARYEAGPARTADVLRAGMRLDDSRRRLASARDSRDAAHLALGALLVTGPVRPGRSASLPALASETEVAERASRSLGVRRARETLARSEAMLALAERAILPRSGVGSSEGSPQAAASPRKWITGAPYLDELRQTVAANARALAQAQAREPAAADAAHAELADALRRVRIHRDSLVPKSKRALSATEGEYRVGRSSYVELDDVQRLWLDTNLSYHRAIRDAHVAYSRLERILGPEGGTL